MAIHKLNYILIPLRKKGSIVYTKIDSEDAPAALQHTWCYTLGYARTKLENGKTVSLHRFVLGLSNSDMDVDHINRDKLDNRKGNLRLCTKAQNNSYALRKKGKNHYRGVYTISQNCYRAALSVGSRKIELGYFKTPEDGARAYNKAALERNARFAVLNEVPDMAVFDD